MSPTQAPHIKWSANCGQKAVLGTMFFPGLLDRMLASKAWKGQLNGEPVSADRIDNLHHPVPADYGAHGRFDNEARDTSLQFRLGANPRLLGFLAAASLALAYVSLSRRSR